MPDKEKEKNQAQEEGSFQVVDRRRFTGQGERRPGVKQPAPETAPPPEPPRVSQAAAPGGQQAAPPKESEQARAARQAYDRAPSPRDYKVDFESLIMSLSTSAMIQLGLVQDPTQQDIPVDPQAARPSIDMLALIQEKTRGNLTSREARLLEEMLYQLRLAYVQATSGKGSGAPRSS